MENNQQIIEKAKIVGKFNRKIMTKKNRTKIDRADIRAAIGELQLSVLCGKEKGGAKTGTLNNSFLIAALMVAPSVFCPVFLSYFAG